MNTDQQLVRVYFWGLRALFAVLDDLKDGAELFYEERHAWTEAEIRALVTYRQRLVAFCEPQQEQ